MECIGEETDDSLCDNCEGMYAYKINMLELQITNLPKMLYQGHNCLYKSPVGVVQDCLDGDGEGLSDSLKSIFIFLLLHTFFTL